MTLEAWVKLSTLGDQWRTVVIKEKPRQLVYALYAYTNGPGAAGNVNVTGGSDVYAQTSSLLPTKTWVHLASTYDGATIRLYANGALIATKSWAGKIVSSTSPMRIGGNTVWGEWFAGQIDDLRVYNRPLGPAEIKSDMNTPVTSGGGGGGGGGAASGSGSTPVDTQPPTTPGTPAVSGATTTSVWLTWPPSTDDVGVAGYQVYRNGSASGTTSGTSYNVTGLTCGTSYTFAVDAYDNAGNRSAKASVTASTSACPPPVGDTQAPTVPANLAVVGTSGNSVTVGWSQSIDDTGVTGYGMYRGASAVGSSYATTYTYTGLACGTTYSLAVDAYDAAGNRSAKSSVSGSTSACPPPPPGDTQAPTTPTSLAVSSTSTGSLGVSWGASSDNVGVSAYGVYLNGASVGSTAGRSYTFSGLSCGTSYALAVDAYDAAGNRSGKASLSASTATCPLPGTADAYVSASGSDGASCSQVAPCRSLDRAYHVVAPGGTVEVAGGSYPGQTVSNDGGKSLGSQPVLFRPAAGASVNLDYLESWASNVHYVGFRLPTNANASPTGRARIRAGHNVVLEDFVGTEPDIWNASSSPNQPIDGLTITGGNWGPFPSCGGGFNIADNPRNVLIENNTFHDYIVPSSCSGAHLDCVHVNQATSITIRGNTFRNCQHFGIFMSDRPADALIENNFLTGGIFGFKLRGDNDASIEQFNNITIRFNSADEINLGTSGSNTLNNVKVENNATLNGIGCRSGGVTFTGNINESGGTCSSSDRQVGNLGFQNAANADFHLNAGSPLIDAATGNAYPSQDIDDQNRPAGGKPDVGADER